MAKQIYLQAGETTVIYRRNFSSVPTQIRFEAIATDGTSPSGTVEIRGSQWIFPKPPQQQPLQAMNTVEAGFWDTFFAIAVTADTDLIITRSKGQTGSGFLWVLGLVMGISIVAVAMLMMTL
ncbi:hypothetical protein [Leptolyngbya iicbica]|uniref:Uncharacterized protein n=2 Tax=Cyanophyceae TaxID=3028117 RepID=A0A4Q7EAT2_9CYAN|nr:hypothetical protein [Leptolyngbya sp. LK]RZM79653.1 hypothetical protein DYY88_13185 [Leptolyngbya sp. LK]